MRKVPPTSNSEQRRDHEGRSRAAARRWQDGRPRPQRHGLELWGREGCDPEPRIPACGICLWLLLAPGAPLSLCEALLLLVSEVLPSIEWKAGQAGSFPGGDRNCQKEGGGGQRRPRFGAGVIPVTFQGNCRRLFEQSTGAESETGRVTSRCEGCEAGHCQPDVTSEVIGHVPTPRGGGHPKSPAALPLGTCHPNAENSSVLSLRSVHVTAARPARGGAGEGRSWVFVSSTAKRGLDRSSRRAVRTSTRAPRSWASRASSRPESAFRPGHSASVFSSSNTGNMTANRAAGGSQRVLCPSQPVPGTQ